MNSSVHGSTGVSPGKLLFGNRLDLNRGILTPFQQTLPSKTPGSPIMAGMINAQDTAHRTVQEMAQENAAQRLTDQPDPTVFPIGSYVLAQYATGPPTRLHTRWQGPMEVISHRDSEYVLLNIVSKKTKRIHASKLKIFLFDPACSIENNVARIIGRASVLGMRGSTDKSRGYNSPCSAYVICTDKSRETPSRGEDKWE